MFKALFGSAALIGFALVIAAVALSASQGALAGEIETKTTMHRFADKVVIDGTEATLMRMDHGVSTTVNTVGLKAGDAVTMWWVVFNQPQNCSDAKCGENDVFNLDDNEKFILNGDGKPPFNKAAHKAAQISVTYANGHVIDAGGKAKFRGQLPVGDTTQTLFGPGLVDPMKAEIHLVLRTHQQAKPGQVDEMTYTLNGGCAAKFPNKPCKDLQFTIFMPPAN
jgi:hypothetical protein